MSDIALPAPAVGLLWAEQGGINVGIRPIEGQPHHIITPAGMGYDQHTSFARIEAGAFRFGTINGFSDWVVGDEKDLVLAYAHARDHFVRADAGCIYWSRTVHPSGWPLAVVFEDGHVFGFQRRTVLRARPFRYVAAV